MCTMERPNLKICIENDGDSESDEDKPIIEDLGVVGASDGTGANEEIVAAGKESKASLFGEEADSATTLEVSTDKPLAVQQPKLYQNKAGEFVTGFDPLSKEYAELREKRAQRFGITDNEKVVSDQDLKALYDSLGIKEENLEIGERGIRLDAIHIRGVNNMSTKDVFSYFQDFAPGALEWVDDTSCNVVWVDPVTAARAMMHMSQAIKDEEINKNKQHQISEQRVNSTDSLSKRDEEPMDLDEDNKIGSEKTASKRDPPKKAEEFDYELNLISENEASDEEMDDINTKVHTEENNKTDTNETKQKHIAKAGERSDTKELDKDRKIKEMDVDQKPKKLETRPKYPVPPGKWRIGVPYLNKADVIYMRYATKADKKQPGAGKKSLYYRKYGNPNFGGMKGLISESRKRKIIASKYHQEELEAKKVVLKAKKITDVPEKTAFDKHVQEAVKSGLKSRLELRGSECPTTEDHSDEVKNQAVAEHNVDEYSNVEEELRLLLSESPPPQKKRTMRMYADDIEEQLRGTRSTAPRFTDSAIQSRLTDARDLIGDARSRITGHRSGSNTKTSFGDLRDILGRKRRGDNRERYRSNPPPFTVQVELD